MKEYKLIELYCSVCDHYDNTLVGEAQRQSNNFHDKRMKHICNKTASWKAFNGRFNISFEKNLKIERQNAFEGLRISVMRLTWVLFPLEILKNEGMIWEVLR